MSFTEPLAWYRVSAKDGSVAKTALVATSPADFKDVDVAREECISKDGTKVPMTVLRPKSVAKDGSAPALLTGYGGFGISSAPRFRPQILAWLEQGGVYAVANIRGGGEFGEDVAQRREPRRTSRTSSTTSTPARSTSSRPRTRRRRASRSRGARTAGSSWAPSSRSTPRRSRPSSRRSGIYDMLRVERDANGAFNVTEYGSVTDPKQFDALYAYSPYHHVKDGVAYPAVLFMTGANDPRVAPYHSRKMTARLQAATSSDAPILLRTSANTGHGRVRPSQRRWRSGPTRSRSSLSSSA